MANLVLSHGDDRTDAGFELVVGVGVLALGGVNVFRRIVGGGDA